MKSVVDSSYFTQPPTKADCNPLKDTYVQKVVGRRDDGAGEWGTTGLPSHNMRILSSVKHLSDKKTAKLGKPQPHPTIQVPC